MRTLHIITETIIPEREIWIQPTIVKEFNDGSKLIEYNWQGAEYAHIGVFEYKGGPFYESCK